MEKEVIFQENDFDGKYFPRENIFSPTKRTLKQQISQNYK